ncbi:MAG TPA: DciA family protein [Vicinamibacterales bacterium]
MLPVQTIAPRVLADIIRRQPESNARTAFAWAVAVGPALARATTVELRNHNMIVCARDVQWARELERARDTILPRLQMLLGPDTVRGLYINA